MCDFIIKVVSKQTVYVCLCAWVCFCADAKDGVLVVCKKLKLKINLKSRNKSQINMIILTQTQGRSKLT